MLSKKNIFLSISPFKVVTVKVVFEFKGRAGWVLLNHNACSSCANRPSAACVREEWRKRPRVKKRSLALPFSLHEDIALAFLHCSLFIFTFIARGWRAARECAELRRFKNPKVTFYIRREVLIRYKFNYFFQKTS